MNKFYLHTQTYSSTVLSCIYQAARRHINGKFISSKTHKIRPCFGKACLLLARSAGNLEEEKAPANDGMSES